MTLDLTEQIHQYLTSAPSSFFAQQKVEIVAHWQGDDNLLWRVRSGDVDAVVKQFLDAGQARSRRQFDGHQHFAPLGLAPQPLWADRYPHGLSRQIIVYHWCTGERISVDEESALLSWAESVATLHSSPIGDLNRFSPHPINLDFYWRIEQGSIARIENWLLTSTLALTATFQEMARAAKMLVESSLPLWENASPASVHGDLSCDHTLTDQGRIIFLDWEMFGLGDPALDVARLLQHEGQALIGNKGQIWLECYLRTTGDSGIAERIAVYQRMLEFHNVVYLLVGLSQHTAGHFDINLQTVLPFMQSALTRALDHAAEALMLHEKPDSATLAAAFFAWLVEATATTN